MAITSKNKNKNNVNPATLLKYLEKLSPESEAESMLAQRLTPDKLIRLRMYCNELAKIKKYIDDAEQDIAEHGAVELFVQGAQQCRRKNPAMQNFLELERMYFTLFNRIERIIDGEIKVVDDIWK